MLKQPRVRRCPCGANWCAIRVAANGSLLFRCWSCWLPGYLRERLDRELAGTEHP